MKKLTTALPRPLSGSRRIVICIRHEGDCRLSGSASVSGQADELESGLSASQRKLLESEDTSANPVVAQIASQPAAPWRIPTANHLACDSIALSAIEFCMIFNIVPAKMNCDAQDEFTHH